MLSKINFDNCRPVPKNIADRVLGEGDVVYRDKETHRINYWDVGSETQPNDPNVYRSVARYDTKKEVVV